MSGSGPSASIVSTTTLLDSPQRSRRRQDRSAGWAARQLLAAARGVLTALRSHSGQRREYTQLFTEPANQDLAMVRLRSPQAHASGWLASPLRQPPPVEGTKESILAVLAVSIDR